MLLLGGMLSQIASPAFAQTVPANAVRLTPMTEAQVRAELKTDPEYAADVSQNDAAILKTADSAVLAGICPFNGHRPRRS
jgi:hypothetical protein